MLASLHLLTIIKREFLDQLIVFGVSSIPVVLHARLNDQMQINSDKTNKKKFFEVEHIHENPIESLDYARINKSVVCYNAYNRTCCPAANHPVEQCQNPRKSVIIFVANSRYALLAPANVLLI